MAAITPIFTGTYSGHLIYNITNYTIGDNFKKYVESMDIVYTPIVEQLNTGFSDTKYQTNATAAVKLTGSIAITLVGDLPHWLMLQLIQLAKATLSGGMTLSLADTWVSTSEYYCKWENAGDFVENNAVLAGGNMLLKFYKAMPYSEFLDIVELENDFELQDDVELE